MIVGAVMAWLGKVAIGRWAAWTQANRTGGRNQLVFAFAITMNGINLVEHPSSSWFMALGLLALAFVYTPLSVLHRRRFGKPPQPGTKYSSSPKSWPPAHNG